MICHTFSQLTVFSLKKTKGAIGRFDRARGENCRMLRSNLQLLQRRCRWWALLIRCVWGSMEVFGSGEASLTKCLVILIEEEKKSVPPKKNKKESWLVIFNEGIDTY